MGLVPLASRVSNSFLHAVAHSFASGVVWACLHEIGSVYMVLVVCCGQRVGSNGGPDPFGLHIL